MTLPENTDSLTVKPILRILYQDEYIVAVDKPSGIFVHRSFMDKDEIYFCVQLLRDQIGQYVYPLHRLDRPTSGVLLFALSAEVASKMGKAFTDRNIHKEYYCITRGHLIEPGLVDYPLKEKLDKIGDKYSQTEKPAQDAQTAFNVITHGTLPIALGKYTSVRYSLVKAAPITGRRHQIRRHLSHLRYPIIGDINYGDNKQNPFFAQHFGLKRLMLHAHKMSFIHPVNNTKLDIHAPIDDAWVEVFTALGWQSIGAALSQ